MTAENFDFLFFTELIGMPVHDLKHRRIGQCERRRDRPADPSGAR